jgi:hypothetical protein
MTLNGVVLGENAHDPPLSKADQEEHVRRIEAKVEDGSLLCCQTGLPITPLSGQGWYKTSGDRVRPAPAKIDTPGNRFECVSYFYQKYVCVNTF